MKQVLKDKAELLLSKHHEEYKKRNGESFTEKKDYTHDQHLFYLHFHKHTIRKIELDEKQDEIIQSFYKKNNDYEFDSLLSNYLLGLGEKSYNTYGRTEQKRVVSNGLEPIIQKIACDLFIQEGVKAVLATYESGTFS